MGRGYRVLSLFDGMGCAHLAMQGAGLQVERYVAFEVDRFCNEVVAHNFPDVERRGDVFDADFTEFEGFDFLMGGSPCTYWSVAQSADRRETTASGAGWKLFQQYVRALREARPRWFVYENNKSMSRAIRESISAEFGFGPVHIDSALVSAQHRQRLYWVGRREPGGTYSRVPVEQPADRGVLLRDVLETGVAWKDKRQCLDANYYKGGTVELMAGGHQSGSRPAAAEPVNVDGYEFVSGESTDRSEVQFLGGFSREGERRLEDGHAYSRNFAQGKRLHGCDAKSVTVTAQDAGLAGNAGLYAVPVEPLDYCPPEDYDVVVTDRNIRATYAGSSGVSGTAQGYTVMLPDSKANVMTAGQCHKSKVIEPLRYPEATRKGYVEVQPGECLDVTAPNSQRRGRLMADKSNALTGSNGFHECMGTVDPPVYEVRNGEIEIRGRRYPIKLLDGRYIIRKLTVRECMRLQTVPEWYDFSCVSNTQAYKMLGNGWTVEVIVHLLRSIMEGEGDAGSGD